MSKQTFKVVDEKVTLSGQDVNYNVLTTFGAYKVRFVLRSNAYKFQSYARAEVWSAASLSWNEVVTRRGEEMQTPDKLCYLPNNSGVSSKHFEADLLALQSMVAAVLD